MNRPTARLAVLVLFVSGAGSAFAAIDEQEIPLSTAPVALYWSPSPVPADVPLSHTRSPLKIAESVSFAPLPAYPLIAITPCRQFNSHTAGPPLANASPLQVLLTGTPCNVPSTAKAVAANITVFNITGASGNGVFKVGISSPPTVAWINYPQTETQRANAGVLPLDGSGNIVVQVNQGAGSIDFIVDVFGYFAEASSLSTFNGFCIGSDCRSSWNGPGANSISPQPQNCPSGEIAVSTGSYQWGCAPNCPMGTISCTTYCATPSSDPNNCGACGTVCSSSHVATVTCGGGVCNGTCASGYADCNANKQTDGCEINILSDVNNCGACGIACNPGWSCVIGTCTP